MKHKLKVIWISFKCTYSFLDWQSYFAIKIVNPFFEMLFFVYLSLFSQSQERLAMVVIGNAILLCTLGCLGDLGMMYLRERYNGTLKFLIVSQRNRFALFIEKGLLHIVDAFTTTLFGLFIGWLIFKIPLFDYPLGWIVVIIAISMFSCVCFGFLFGSFCILINDINLVYNLISMSMLFLCGANIELTSLPLVLQYVAYCFPLTRGIQAIQNMLMGDTIGAVLPLLFQEFLLGCMWLLIAFLVMSFVEKQAIKKATLDLI